MPNVHNRNSELIGNLMPDFWSRKDAIIALSNAMISPQTFLSCRGFWPMSIVTPAGLIRDLSDPAGGGSLTTTAGAALGVTVGFVPCMTFNGAGHATVATTANFLFTGAITFGAWVYATTTIAAARGIMGRWRNDGLNERSYLLYSNASTFGFGVSVDGTSELFVPAYTFTINLWYRLVCRFIPSTEIALFVNGRKATSTVAAVPATLYVAGTQPFRIGSYNNTPAYFPGGNVAFPFFAASNQTDSAIFADFEGSRAAFGV